MAHGRPLSPTEEFANAITHGSGLLASLVGVPVLVLAAAAGGSIRHVIACSVFAGALVVLYGVSTAYHACPPSRAKRVLQLADHMAIYLLIAGTYTPFTIGVLRGTVGWSLFGVIWGLAALGIIYKGWLGMRYRRFSTLFYLGMGWLALVALRPMMEAIPAAGLAWIAAGGLCYTVGVIFYQKDHRLFWHTVWHLFVLAGSACHYVAVLRYATGTIA